MTTFDEVLYWSGTDLSLAGDALVKASRDYESVYYELYDLKTTDLEGQTAETEAKARRVLADDAMDLWTKLGKSGNDLIDASTAVTNLCSAAWDIRSRVQASGLTISSGVVMAPPVPQGDSTVDTIRQYQTEITLLMDQVADTIAYLQGVYDEIAGYDETAAGPSLEIINAGDRAPDPSWTADEVNDWWTALSEDEREHIINTHPSWIGNRDGIPVEDRDAANRVWLPIMQAAIDAQVKDYEPKTEMVWVSSGLNGGYFKEQTHPGYAALLERQRDIHALSAMFSDPRNAGNRSLLVLDNAGDHFRAAIGTGDISTADHVIVNTPGMTTTVAGGLVRDDGSVGGSLGDTERIINEARKHSGDETVAGVTWLGYDAPGWDETLGFQEGTVLNDNEAEKTGPDLAGFYDGIQATHAGDPHLVAGAHSYGSVGTGYALRLSTAPDAAVVWGSPGPSSVDASELGMAPGQLYAAAANGDVVAASGMYGGNPTTSPHSDFTALSTGAQPGLEGSSGHSEYTKDGSTSLHNIGQVLAGQEPDYVDP